MALSRYRAPLRIDLAGGTLDIWPLYLTLEAPVTANLAITRYAWASVTTDGEGGRPASSLVARLAESFGSPGATVTTHVDCPRGSGLGGSSALAVALTAALFASRGERIGKARLLSLVRDVEAREIRTPTGDQDYLAALHGGLSILRFGPGGAVRDPEPAAAADLAERIVLFYTGLPHFSGINNWAVFRAVFDGDRKVKGRLQSIARVAGELAAAATEGDLDGVGRLVGDEWRHRKGLAAGITTPAIDRAFALGRRHGAIAGKVCGAGGGGCAFLYARAGAAPALASMLTAEGFAVLPFRRARHGVERVARAS